MPAGPPACRPPCRGAAALQVTGTEALSVAEGNDNYSGHAGGPPGVTDDNYPCIRLPVHGLPADDDTMPADALGASCAPPSGRRSCYLPKSGFRAVSWHPPEPAPPRHRYQAVI